MIKLVLALLVASAAATSLRGPVLRPDKPVAEYSREPLPPRQLSGHVAHDVHRNFPYDAFSTTFKCDKGPCPGSQQTGCGCPVCPCVAAPKPDPCGTAVNPCGTVAPMPVAGPASQSVGPKTGGNGDPTKPVMVPRGTLDQAAPKPSSFIVEAEEVHECDACCPKPCQPTCTCGSMAPMPVAGPKTKTKSPKTGGNGDEAKPVMVPHGTLPKGPLPPTPASPCAAPPCGGALLEVVEEAEPYVVKAEGKELVQGNTDKPEKGETVTRTKATGGSNEWRKPTLVQRGQISQQAGALESAPAADPEGDRLRAAVRQESTANAAAPEAQQTNEEEIHSFVGQVSNKL